MSFINSPAPFLHPRSPCFSPFELFTLPLSYCFFFLKTNLEEPDMAISFWILTVQHTPLLRWILQERPGPQEKNTSVEGMAWSVHPQGFPFPALHLPRGEASGNPPRGRPLVHTFFPLTSLPTKNCHLPPASTRTLSLATAVADLQHTFKGVQSGDHEWGTLCSGKTGRKGLQIVKIFPGDFISPVSCLFSHLEKH